MRAAPAHEFSSFFTNNWRVNIMGSASSVFLLLLAVTLHDAAALQISPCYSARHEISSAERSSGARMLDASLAADAIVSSSSVLPVYVPSDFGHTLDNLVPDMFNTAMIAGLGLMGAYVTQVRESTVQRTSPALVTKLTLCACLNCVQGTEGVESGRNPYDDFERPLKPKRRIESASDDDLDDEFLNQLM